MFKHQIKNDPEIEGLLFVCYDDGSGGASYKGNYFATVDYATGEYKIGNSGIKRLSSVLLTPAIQCKAPKAHSFLHYANS